MCGGDNDGMKKRYLLLLLGLLATGFMVPEQRIIPVAKASPVDWHPKSFWFYPWGRSGTHKGIDIFAARHTPVIASSAGLVLRTGKDFSGGNVVYVLSAGWCLHYYAHLQRIDVAKMSWVKAGQQLGTVGDSGNAKGKPTHLHYSIRSLIPRPWESDPSVPQGWRKMFYINPHEFLTGGENV